MFIDRYGSAKSHLDPDWLPVGPSRVAWRTQLQAQQFWALAANEVEHELSEALLVLRIQARFAPGFLRRPR
jgi:hypothetical protein